MVDTTEQKILDVALDEFAKEGYVGTRTRVIAEKSGFSEMTLFRKFKTKENLFNMVLAKNKQIFFEDLESILIEKNAEDLRDFLKSLIEGISNLIGNNLKFIMISFHEGYRVPAMRGVNNLLITRIERYLEEQDILKNKKTDFKVLVFNFITFLFFFNLDKPMKSAFDDHEKAIEEFIDNSVKILQC
ncbi:TetR/AcrR family transcriptional regulator [Methanobacterium oryzae]|uniref:TetR/AcrR family transcriptional regulator n=1 Tax=Methanobacterium oryzae TaxID=69540 RepID=UPI003D1C0BE1